MSRKTWERRGKRGLTRMLGRLVRAGDGAGDPPDLASLGAILLVRQQNQLGDMLLGSPVFRAVRARAPGARIDLVTSPANHAAALGNPRLDEVLCYDKAALLRRPAAAKRFVDRLRDARYDVAIVLSTVSFSTTSAWLAVLSGAHRRAGRPGPDGKGADIAADVYHWVLPPPVPGRHQSGVALDGVTPFGAPDDDWTPEMGLAAQETADGEALLAGAVGARGTGDGLRVVLHPGAGKRPNRWPAERFGEVAAALRRAGHRPVLAAGPSETELLARADEGAGEPLPRLPGAGVRTLAGAIAAADFLVANDTGILHVGAAVGVPVLALFGPTDPAEWCPAAPRVRWLRAPDGDLDRLAIEPVRAAVLGLAAHVAEGAGPPAGTAPAPVRPGGTT